jgi:hypothetical protein
MPPRSRRSKLVLLALAGGLLATAARARSPGPSAASGLLYERALMSTAGERCGLFAPGVARALDAARTQARGAALRAGDTAAALDAVEARAEARAASVDCRAPGLITAADRVRTAFADYAQLSVMRFPGPRSAWRAERPDARLAGDRWRLVQALPGAGGWLLFGSVNGRPALLDARRGVGPAAGARLRLRDPARLAGPFLAGAPPAAVSRVFFASGRSVAARALLPAGADAGMLYTFPPNVLDALSALDPRETAQVELVYPAAGRERLATAQVEIGDLAAARAFLAAAGPRARRP